MWLRAFGSGVVEFSSISALLSKYEGCSILMFGFASGICSSALGSSASG